MKNCEKAELPLRFHELTQNTVFVAKLGAMLGSNALSINKAKPGQFSTYC